MVEAFDCVRKKWKKLLDGGEEINLDDKDIQVKIQLITKEAYQNWESLDKSEQRIALWDDLQAKNSAHVTAALRRICSMALAFNTAGSELKGNKSLEKDILDSLDWMCVHKYNGDWYADWWDWQIGAPIALHNCTILMYDSLSDTQVENYMKSVKIYMGDPATDHGANRSWRCKVYALYGILARDEAPLERASECFGSLFDYVTDDEGFYEDDSFIQHHDHPYTLGYGVNLLTDIAEFLYLLDGSPWQIKVAGRENMYRWVEKSYSPFIYHGLAMDMVRGREMARFYTQDNAAGANIIAGIIRVAQLANDKKAQELKSMIRFWLKGKTRDFFYKHTSSLDILTIAKAIVDEKDGLEAKEPLLCRVYPRMDRAVQIRDGYGIGISMHSTRVANYEADIKHENLKGWHTGDGMVYLYNTDDTQYNDNFWPTVDSHRLSGTTILKNTPLENDCRGQSDWAGGVTLNDTFGCIGMEYHAHGYSLQAQKSWFLLEEEVVALGAGITSKDDIPVETVVENRKLQDMDLNSLTLDGEKASLESGREMDYSNVSRAHLAGKEQGSQIGYFFPEKCNLSVIRDVRTDNWDSIYGNPAQSNTENHTRAYMTMWLDHGVNPMEENYSYVLLPGMDDNALKDYAECPAITILRNDACVQAVAKAKSGITAANFWTDTIQTVGGITCNKKASLIMKEDNHRMEIVIADPTWKNEDTIEVTIDKKAKGVLSSDSTILVKQCDPCIILEIDVKGRKGTASKLVLDVSSCEK